MKLSTRFLTTTLAAAALAVPSAVTTAQPASAAVYGCTATVSTYANSATARCNGGTGSFRVAAVCQPLSYGLPTTIYGPWTSTTQFASTVFGGVSCRISTATVQTRLW